MLKHPPHPSEFSVLSHILKIFQIFPPSLLSPNSLSLLLHLQPVRLSHHCDCLSASALLFCRNNDARRFKSNFCKYPPPPLSVFRPIHPDSPFSGCIWYLPGWPWPRLAGSYPSTCLFKHSFCYTPLAGQVLQDPLLQKRWMHQNLVMGVGRYFVYGEFPELLRDVMCPTVREQ